MRRLFCLFLLICLPLHGFAMQWGPLLAGENQTIGHQLEHDEHVPHHHHEEDGSVHYDDSDESEQHLLDHPTSPQPASPVPPFMAGAPEQLVSLVLMEGASGVPDPLLDCPHRPPAFALG